MGKPQMVCRQELAGKVFGSASITQILSKVSDSSIQESWKAQGKLSWMVLCTSCTSIQLEKKSHSHGMLTSGTNTSDRGQNKKILRVELPTY